jgi:hypothetical protein cdiviTM7_02271
MNDSPETQEFKPSPSDGIDLTEPIAWNAPEGVRVQRGAVWYVLFAIVLAGLMALAILVFQNWTFAILLPIMAVALFVLSNKNPQTINYAISPKGIYIADTLHDFSEFRAFGLLHENNQHSILLLPVKRFSPGLTIYFSEAEGEKIVDMLGARLPMQEIKPDALEKFIRLIKL